MHERVGGEALGSERRNRERDLAHVGAAHSAAPSHPPHPQIRRRRCGASTQSPSRPAIIGLRSCQAWRTNAARPHVSGSSKEGRVEERVDEDRGAGPGRARAAPADKTRGGEREPAGEDGAQQPADQDEPDDGELRQLPYAAGLAGARARAASARAQPPSASSPTCERMLAGQAAARRRRAAQRPEVTCGRRPRAHGRAGHQGERDEHRPVERSQARRRPNARTSPAPTAAQSATNADCEYDVRLPSHAGARPRRRQQRAPHVPEEQRREDEHDRHRQVAAVDRGVVESGSTEERAERIRHHQLAVPPDALVAERPAESADGGERPPRGADLETQQVGEAAAAAGAPLSGREQDAEPGSA